MMSSDLVWLRRRNVVCATNISHVAIHAGGDA